MKKVPQLLAPAGSFEALRAAVAAGASAVYFGVEQLNMRAKSTRSFSVAHLPKISQECRAAGIKCYLTLNTILYDHDLQLARRIVRAAKKHRIDAVIAADPAVLEICRAEQVPVHLSTQANVSNIQSVRFFASVADTIVLARELTLQQTAAICREIRRKRITGPSGKLVQIEIFAHGALCMAISGKCYLSLHEQNASANRGACTQNCRHSYRVTDLQTNSELVVENEFIMSAKDLCTIDMLPEMVQSGADILKIEGRTKSAEYVYEVTCCYREALDALAAGTYDRGKVEGWLKRLRSVYNRGFWEGYYLGRRLGEWTASDGSVATEKKIYVGKGVKYYPKAGVAEFRLEAGAVKKGDELLIIGTKSGVVRHQLAEMCVNGQAHEAAGRGDSLTFPLLLKTGKDDKLYKLVKQSDA
jgi:U32 family peptidase